MDSLVVAKDIIDQFDDEISGQEAMESIADWTDWSVAVSSTRTPDKTKTKNIWISRSKIFQNPTI